jgi:hypothetical protein
MLGPLRTLISVAFLAILLWAAFTIKLGRYTFAEHIDRIGQTDEAKELIDGTRSRISPGLEEVKQRMFGEYVEAPTHLAAPVVPVPSPPRAQPKPRPESVPVATSTVVRDAAGPATSASTAEAIKLPGRRKAAPARATP